MMKQYIKIGYTQDFPSTSFLNSSLIVIVPFDVNPYRTNVENRVSS